MQAHTLGDWAEVLGLAGHAADSLASADSHPSRQTRVAEDIAVGIVVVGDTVPAAASVGLDYDTDLTH